MANASCGISHTIKEQHAFDKACLGCVKRRLNALEIRVKAAEAVCETAKVAQYFGVEWGKAHQKNDYLVTLDHQDEMSLADLVVALCEALTTWEAVR